MSQILQYPKGKNERPLPGELLYMYRLRAELTQARLAELIGLKSGRMVLNWEGGYSLPTAEKLKKVISLFWQYQVFTPDHEPEEARQLWQTVKEFFETRLNKNETYPVFDANWFASLALNPRPPQPSEKDNFISYPDPKSNLPQAFGQLSAPLNLLVGREAELARILELLASPARPETSRVRLLTLVGPGGIGKTRLAQEVAARLQGRFKHGLIFVDLASLREPRLVIPAISRALGLKEADGQNLLEGLKSDLAGKELLLILDNFEQVLAAGPQLSELLVAAPALKLLVTSRESLHLYREYEFEVPPLAFPDPKNLPTLEKLLDYSALKLVVDHISTLDPTFTLSQTNAPILSQLCELLEGLPLALELAASRIKLLGPVALLERLKTTSRLTFLTNGPRDWPHRQQALRNTLAWSYELLNAEEKLCFERLAVFNGGFSLDAAEAVVGLRALENIASLLDKSLVRKLDPGAEQTEPRFTMLETVREYALERLAEAARSDESTAQVWQRHTDFFLALAERLTAQSKEANDDSRLARLELEQANLRQALLTLSEQSRSDKVAVERLIQVVSALWRFWYRKGYFTEGRYWLNLCLAQARKMWPDNPQAQRQQIDLILKLSSVSLFSDGPEKNLSRLSEAEHLTRSLLADAKTEDKIRLTRIYYSKGLTLYLYNRLPQAADYFQQVLGLAQDSGDEKLQATAKAATNRLMVNQGLFGKAAALLPETIQALEQTGSWTDWMITVAYLGMCLAAQGQAEQGLREVERALAYAQKTGHASGLAISYNNVAWVALMSGDWRRAWEAAKQAVAAAQSSGDLFYLYTAYSFKGWAECHLGQPDAAYESRSQAKKIQDGLAQQVLLDDWFTVADAQIAFQRGSIQEALGLAQQAVWAAQKIKGLYSEGLARRVWAEALYRLAKDDPAKEKLSLSVKAAYYKELQLQLAASLQVLEKGMALVEVERTRQIWNKIPDTI